MVDLSPLPYLASQHSNTEQIVIIMALHLFNLASFSFDLNKCFSNGSVYVSVESMSLVGVYFIMIIQYDLHL